MKWIHVKALFESDDISLAEELVSDIFFALGLTGVVCQVPLDAPPEGFGSDALPIPDENSVSGYIPDTDASLEILEKIRKRGVELGKSDIRVVIETKIVDQEDWAESWKKFFHVCRITDRIVIKPAWREFKPGTDDVVIELDPGMAFGTGTHPTTSMCIALIEKYIKPDDRFLDVGTGSGILMIAAAKLGASSLAGVDTDEVAVQVATENLIKNAISSELFYVNQTTLDKYIKEQKQRHQEHLQKMECPKEKGIKEQEQSSLFQFNLIAANIIAEVLIEIMPDIKTALKTGGIVILSGIIREREKILNECLKSNGFSISEVRRDGEWVAIAAKKA